MADNAILREWQDGLNEDYGAQAGPRTEEYNRRKGRSRTTTLLQLFVAYLNVEFMAYNVENFVEELYTKNICRQSYCAIASIER